MHTHFKFDRFFYFQERIWRNRNTIPIYSQLNTHDKLDFEVKYDGVKAGWIFGRKDQGYIALHSKNQGSWRPKDENLFKSIYHENYEEEFERAEDYEYWAAGHANIWVCEMGEQSTHGSFDDFINSISKAKLEGDTFGMSYESPSIGEVKTGWCEPLTVNNEVICTKDYKRYDNPYCKEEFDTECYTISCGARKLKLDFANNLIIEE